MGRTARPLGTAERQLAAAVLLDAELLDDEEPLDEPLDDDEEDELDFSEDPEEVSVDFSEEEAAESLDEDLPFDELRESVR